MKTIQVLLSTYNGEKYLCEQLDSILRQKQVSVSILVRDDGSSDGTIAILNSYANRYENIQVIEGENIGAAKSFLELLQLTDEKSEYYALADQDDIWLPGKLYRAVSLLEQENRIPLVYCSNQKLLSEDGKICDKAICYPKVKTAFENALVENMCTGCTCVLNKELLSLMRGKKCEYTVMHDFWIYLLGTCFGKVIYDEESFILYRQHRENVVGTADSILENYKRRLRNFRKHRGQLTKQAQAFFKEYGAEIPEEKRVLLQNFMNSPKDWNVRWNLVFHKQIFRQRISDDFIMKILVLCGLV